MKKLIFLCVIMAALCACEAPGSGKEKEKETVILDAADTPTEMPDKTGDDSKDKDDKEADADITPTQAPAEPDKKTEPDKDAAGPTATPAPVTDGDKDMISKENEDSGIDVNISGGVVCEKGRELFCLAASEQEGRDIAAVYGIIFVDYSYGVATFTTNEDPAAVIQRGRDNGLKSLEINYSKTVQ